MIATSARDASRADYVASENILVDCATLKGLFFNLEKNQVKSILVLIAVKIACGNLCYRLRGEGREGSNY